MGGGGMGGGRGMGPGRSRLEDFVEGKLFIGGLEPNMTREDLESYCSGWCEPSSAHCSSAPSSSTARAPHSVGRAVARRSAVYSAD